MIQRGAVLGRLASAAGFAAVASFGTIGGVLAAESKRVTVPAGTIVRLHLADSAQYGPGALSSLKNAKDTPFYCEADADVVIDGRVVVAKGAPGQGTIVASAAGDTNAMMSYVNGHSGSPKLVIRFDWITGVDGLKIRLGDVTTAGGEEGGAPAQTVPGPTYTQQTKMGGGLFNRKIVGGGNIDDRQIFELRVASTVHTVTSATPRSSDAGFAH